MRYLNKYNEEVMFEYEWDEECVKLQNEINKYNHILINDTIWKNFYHRIDKYYEKQLDSEFLESIIEFGKNRIKEIDKENKELKVELESLFDELDDRDDEYTEEVQFVDNKKSNSENFETYLEPIVKELTGSSSLEFHWHVYLLLNSTIKRKKKIGNEMKFVYTSDEVTKYWPKLINLTNSIKSLGLNVDLNFQPNWNQIIFYIKREDI